MVRDAMSCKLLLAQERVAEMYPLFPLLILRRDC